MMTAALTVYTAGFLFTWFTMTRVIAKGAKLEYKAATAHGYDATRVTPAWVIAQVAVFFIAAVWPGFLPVIVFIAIAKLKAIWRAIRETDGA